MCRNLKRERLLKPTLKSPRLKNKTGVWMNNAFNSWKFVVINIELREILIIGRRKINFLSKGSNFRLICFFLVCNVEICSAPQLRNLTSFFQIFRNISVVIDEFFLWRENFWARIGAKLYTYNYRPNFFHPHS